MKFVCKLISSVAAFLVITAASAFAGPEHTGVVLDTASGGGYTYVEVDENGNKFWIAGPETSVKKGAVVNFSEQVWMSNFTSKALNRTFAKILFVGGINTAQSNAAPSAKKPEKSPEKRSKSSKGAKTYTIDEVFSKKSELKGKAIKVRGEVVKVSENIMGRTWVHIKDGTGRKGGDTLIFRSAKDKAAVGSTVTAEGVLETDKDFGFGYFYSVIVEESTFSK